MTQLVFVSGVCFTVVPEKAANCGFIEQNRHFYLFYSFFFSDEKDHPVSAEVSHHDIPNILKQIYFQIVIAI